MKVQKKKSPRKKALKEFKAGEWVTILNGQGAGLCGNVVRTSNGFIAVRVGKEEIINKRWWALDRGRKSSAGTTVACSKPRTGPWSADELKRLKKAYAKHGNSWHDVAADVGTRAYYQTRSKWQNIHTFSGKRNSGEWSKKECALFDKAFAQHGENWMEVARVMGNRSYTQVINHWRGIYTTSGTIRTGRWTKKECSLFNKAVKEHKGDWTEIARIVKTRTQKQCLCHYRKYCH